MMPAQRATINLLGNGAFMVLSLPVSALGGVDDNQDGGLDQRELNAHKDAIEALILRGLALSDAGGQRPLQILRLSLEPPDDDVNRPSPQLLMLGRFALAESQSTLHFRIGLFGTGAEEGQFILALTRGSESQQLTLKRSQPEAALFPTGWRKWISALQQRIVALPIGVDILFLCVLGLLITRRYLVHFISKRTHLGLCVVMAVASGLWIALPLFSSQG